jgi:hypothetical protein
MSSGDQMCAALPSVQHCPALPRLAGTLLPCASPHRL